MSSIRESNPSQATDRVTRKFRAILPKAVVLAYALMPVLLQAQQDPDPCNADILKPQAPIPACPICTSAPLPSAPEPGNVTDGAKSALSRAWIDPNGTDKVLQAFGLLISGRPVFSKDSQEWLTVNQQVLAKLIAARPQSGDLFRAVLGNPDRQGEPTVQGLADLVDMLSKASTRGKVDAKIEIEYHHQLFGCTQVIVDQLFTGGGIPALARVNDAFSQKNQYVAMHDLLEAVWAQKHDANRLEQLRTAFAISVDDLAKQVASRIAPAK
jgi:hypothetical protein